jgi:hypothetical protein
VFDQPLRWHALNPESQTSKPKPQTLKRKPPSLTIILCAGKKRVATSFETSISNAMTPINGFVVLKVNHSVYAKEN